MLVMKLQKRLKAEVLPTAAVFEVGVSVVPISGTVRGGGGGRAGVVFDGVFAGAEAGANA